MVNPTELILRGISSKLMVIAGENGVERGERTLEKGLSHLKVKYRDIIRTNRKTLYLQGFAILGNCGNQQEEATTDIAALSRWFIRWPGISICKRKLPMCILK